MKEQNTGLSVCEIGASIGKMWRELSDEDKSRYNDDFTQDKVRLHAAAAFTYVMPTKNR